MRAAQSVSDILARSLLASDQGDQVLEENSRASTHRLAGRWPSRSAPSALVAHPGLPCQTGYAAGHAPLVGVHSPAGPCGQPSLLAVSGSARSDEEHALGGVRRETVLAALNELPPDQRQFLDMAYFEGLTQVQIAERTRIPLDTIRAATYQALRYLPSSFLLGEARVDTL